MVPPAHHEAVVDAALAAFVERTTTSHDERYKLQMEYDGAPTDGTLRTFSVPWHSVPFEVTQ